MGVGGCSTEIVNQCSADLTQGVFDLVSLCPQLQKHTHVGNCLNQLPHLKTKKNNQTTNKN